VWVQERGLPCSPGAGYSGDWFKSALFEILAGEQVTEASISGATDFLAARRPILDSESLTKFVQFVDNFCYRGIKYSEFANTLIRNALCSALPQLKLDKTLETQSLTILKGVKGDKSTPKRVPSQPATKTILEQMATNPARLDFLIQQGRSAHYFRTVFLQDSRKYSDQDVKALHSSICETLEPAQRESHLHHLLKHSKGAQRWLLKQCLQHQARSAF
jgi:hypothetical protein